MKLSYKKNIKIIYFVNADWLTAISMMFVAIFYSNFAHAYNYKNQIHDEYYQRRVANYEARPISINSVVMIGDSITEMGGWNEYFSNKHVLNRGISGDTTYGILNRLGEIKRHRPRKIFILVGTNDLFHGEDLPQIIDRYRQIVASLKLNKTEIFLESVLPINPKMGADIGQITNSKIFELNREIKKIGIEFDVNYIDLSRMVKEKDGSLRRDLTFDGIHLNGRGYALVVDALKVR